MLLERFKKDTYFLINYNIKLHLFPAVGNSYQ